MNQEEHHHKTTFQDEFRRFLKKYEIEYDERYVWENARSPNAEGVIESQPRATPWVKESIGVRTPKVFASYAR
jgi:hypothetical protein